MKHEDNSWSKLRTMTFILLIAQALTVALAWSLNPIGQKAETAFAFLLAANLVTFSMVSYIQRVWKTDGGVRGGMLLVGSLVVLFFFLFILFV